MNMNLQELCQLWRYQNTECRVTQMLKDSIQGYDNNNPFSVNKAQKERQAWLQKQKFNRKKSVDPLDALKQEYLHDLLHPEQIYLKPRKPEYQIVKQPYGKNHPMLKNYQDAAKYNLQSNIVNFQIYSQQKTNKQKEVRKHVDYVKTFHDKFGEVLQKTSPEFWKLLLFYLLKKIVQFKNSTNEELSHQLNTLVQDEIAIKYLVTFRKQLCQFLEESKFLQREVNIKFDQSGKKDKKKNQKQKTTKWFQAEQVVDSMDFLKLKDNQLVQKIPNLKRYDHAEYIQIRMQPLPKIRTIDIERIRVSDCFSPKYAKCFESEYLNTAQSYVYDHAYNSNQDMLVCAPTGAGKTNIATLTMLHAIKQVKNEEDVKIVYISPMKALANELVQKFSIKLPHLKTRQSTGDIQLSQRQLATTNILFTTPQKWDVTTRKSAGILQNVNLIILDQVHLLNDERGWVIQSIVARMFRTIERTQKHIRLVALSATLPNYYDVGDFLKVDREKGLFYFDNNYRPVPLTISFVGIKNPKDSTNNISRNRRVTDIYNQKCYDIAMSHLKNDKQVLCRKNINWVNSLT